MRPAWSARTFFRGYRCYAVVYLQRQQQVVVYIYHAPCLPASFVAGRKSSCYGCRRFYLLLLESKLRNGRATLLPSPMLRISRVPVYLSQVISVGYS